MHMKDTGCQETTHCLNENGYGQVRRGGVTWLEHRWVYAQQHGLSREQMVGVVVRHTCDNPRCVNPAHLVAGTQADNVQDMIDRGRIARNEQKGEQCKLTAEQVNYIKANCVPRSRTVGCVQMAERFGVSHSLVKAIMRGEKREFT